MVTHIAAAAPHLTFARSDSSRSAAPFPFLTFVSVENMCAWSTGQLFYWQQVNSQQNYCKTTYKSKLQYQYQRVNSQE